MATRRFIWRATTDKMWSLVSSFRPEPKSTRCVCGCAAAGHNICVLSVTNDNLVPFLQENERGFSPLHFASSSRQGALCQELLLTHGAHINMQVCACTEQCAVCVSCQLITLWKQRWKLILAPSNSRCIAIWKSTGEGVPGGCKLLRGCGDIHSISLKLLISDFLFFLPSCDTDLMIYDKSDIILDGVSHVHMLS